MSKKAWMQHASSFILGIFLAWAIKPKVVRAQMWKTQLIEQIGDDLSIVDISNMDMKGNFPSRMMNMVISKMLTKGIKEITDAMNKQ